MTVKEFCEKFADYQDYEIITRNYSDNEEDLKVGENCCVVVGKEKQIAITTN